MTNRSLRIAGPYLLFPSVLIAVAIAATYHFLPTLWATLITGLLVRAVVDYGYRRGTDQL